MGEGQTALKKLALTIAMLFIVGAGFLAATAWYPTPNYELTSARQTYPLMTWDEYEQRAADIEPPVTLEGTIGQGAAYLFGAEHSNDPSHPQFRALDAAYRDFEPTVVIVEGRPSFLLPQFMDATENYGESGRLIELAKQDNVPAYSWELSREEEVDLLKAKFTAQQTAIYLLMRPFSGGNSASEAEQDMAAIIDDRGHRPGMDGTVSNLDEFQALWDQEFNQGEDWRELNGIYGAPSFLNDMFEYGNDIRDQKLLNIVRELTEKDERVMVTMGWSHTVRIEGAFAEMRDQGR